MNQNKTKINIEYAYFIFTLIATLMCRGAICDQGEIEMMQFFSVYMPQINEFVIFLITILMGYIAQLLMLFPVHILYISYKITKKKHNKDRLEKVDFKNDTYYREIIPKYSVAVLSYIDNFELDSNDVGAALLSLEKKGKIRIGEEIIELLNDDTTDLARNEKYLISCIKMDQTPTIDLQAFKKEVMADTQEAKLLEKKMNIGKIFLKMIGGLILSTILLYVLVAAFALTVDTDAYEATKQMPWQIPVLIIIVIFFAMFIPHYLRTSFFMHIGFKIKDPFVRSKEGRELNEKLEGLRKYIEDYSNLQDKEKEALILWEEYLIYSMVFGINKKASENILNKVTII